MASSINGVLARNATLNDHREATELEALEHVAPIQSPTDLNGSPSNSSQQQMLSRPIKKFWKSQVAAIVLHDKCRDHFALERTFLGYLRTSLALAMLGIVVAQLFQLQNPKPTIGSYPIGIPLASIFIVAAILVLLLGAFRFWRQQNAMLRSKVHSGGWEIVAVMLTVFIVLIVLLALIVAIDAAKA